MNRAIIIIEKYRNYLFFLLLVALYLILDYQTILFLRPQGIHFIRQTDSLSFVANYFKNGFHFFQPQVFNLQSTDGKAASEFPILYYLTAVFYLIFNEHEFILRLITMIIVSFGFFYLFKLLYLFLQDLVYAIGFSFLFLSSTVLLYYANNFLPDPSALGLTFIGWYFFFSFIKNKNNSNKSLFTCFLFFSLASLIKVSYFINPITAILSIIAYDISKKTRIKNILQKIVRPLIIFILSLVVVLAWNLYVNYYNKINNDYFLMQSMPIWSISKDQIAVVWEHVTIYWYNNYYSHGTFQFFFYVTVASILFLKKSERIILLPSLILTMGSICYFLLFFAQFKDHDYYFIVLFPGIILLVVNSFVSLKNKFPGLINGNIAKLLFIILCVFSLKIAKEGLEERYKNSVNDSSIIGYKLSGTRHYLDSLGVSENAKIIIISDVTPNGGLYFINRPGWNLKDTSEKSLTELKIYIREGADYVLLTDKKYTNISFNGEKIGEENGILIYKLKNTLIE